MRLGSAVCACVCVSSIV
uniref:Uncharacterized protein n=1 Tax=Arundo donax TaxID=35708 RepID=A0A0A9ELM8_ARUDO